ncbi:MAG: hypothetical protein ABI647_12950 [Gemmatimonadota bacterium]
MDLAPLPGGDLIAKGLADLARGEETDESLLVSVGAARLTSLGIPVRGAIPEPEERLYRRLAQASPNAAHSRYNALIRRLVSFARASGCAR